MDSNLIWDIAYLLGHWGVILFWTVIIHEFGHIVYGTEVLDLRMKLKWKQGGIAVGTPKDYKGMEKWHYIRLQLFGILFGATVIIFDSLTYPLSIILLIPYVVGCKHDIMNIKRRLKND